MCVYRHPYRSLIISGGRDSLVKLWDPRQPLPVCTIQTHKLPVNAVSWSANGTLFATGAKDGLVRVFDVRKMHDCLTFQGHDSDVTALAWHPQHERSVEIYIVYIYVYILYESILLHILVLKILILYALKYKIIIEW